MADNSDDTNFFWQSKYGIDTTTGIEQYIDGSDALGNSNFTIAFEHVASGKTVFFKAFVTKYSEDFNSNWTPTTAFGRTDPIYTFSDTRRVISLGFSVPAGSESEAYENVGRIQQLTQFLYPSYYDTAAKGQDSQYALGSSPLVRLKMMNLIAKQPPTTPPGGVSGDDWKDAQDPSRAALIDAYAAGVTSNDPSKDGLLGAISNCSITYELAKEGVLEVGKGTVLPNNYNISLTFNPIHENTIGFHEKEALDPKFPYNARLKDGGTLKVDVDNDQQYNERINKERNMQAAKDIAESQFHGLFGGRRKTMAQGRAQGESYFMGIKTSNLDFWENWWGDNQEQDRQSHTAKAGSIGDYLGQEATARGGKYKS